MRFSPKVLPSCLVAISLFGCAEQPQAKIEVKEAAKLPTKPSKKRGTQAAYRTGEERKGDWPDLGLTGPVIVTCGE